jgi:hypothetical protein
MVGFYQRLLDENSRDNAKQCCAQRLHLDAALNFRI